LKIAVLGLGNVLQGDDGVGPTVVQRLAAAYEFEPQIVVEDLWTPGLHLHPLLVDLDAVIIIDTVLADAAPGSVRLYRRDDLPSGPVGPRISPHDPGLIETLLALDFLGSALSDVCVVGVVPENTSAGTELTAAVEQALPEVEDVVLRELERLEVSARLKQPPEPPDLWWK
jgi:hydrogenase maturation protease